MEKKAVQNIGVGVIKLQGVYFYYVYPNQNFNILSHQVQIYMFRPRKTLASKDIGSNPIKFTNPPKCRCLKEKELKVVMNAITIEIKQSLASKIKKYIANNSSISKKNIYRR